MQGQAFHVLDVGIPLVVVLENRHTLDVAAGVEFIGGVDLAEAEGLVDDVRELLGRESEVVHCVGGGCVIHIVNISPLGFRMQQSTQKKFGFVDQHVVNS